jgi:hypothetical protein
VQWLRLLVNGFYFLSGKSDINIFRIKFPNTKLIYAKVLNIKTINGAKQIKIITAFIP